MVGGDSIANAIVTRTFLPDLRQRRRKLHELVCADDFSASSRQRIYSEKHTTLTAIVALDISELLTVRRPGEGFGSTPRRASAAEDILDGEFVRWNLRQRKGRTGEQEERYDRKIASLHMSSMTFLKRSSLALRNFKQEKTLLSEKQPYPHERNNRNRNPYAEVKVMCGLATRT